MFSFLSKFYKKKLNFYQNKPKINLFLQKMKCFECWVLHLKTPNGLWRMGAELPVLRAQPFPPPHISGYAFDTRRALLVLASFKILQWQVIELTAVMKYYSNAISVFKI